MFGVAREGRGSGRAERRRDGDVRGRIAQKGSPEQLLAHPANDFVASFVGADRGKRALTEKVVDGRTVLVDSDGRAAGVLSEVRR